VAPEAVEKRSESSIDWPGARKAALAGIHMGGHMGASIEAHGHIMDVEADSQGSREGPVVASSRSESKTPAVSCTEQDLPALGVQSLAGTSPGLKPIHVASSTKSAAWSWQTYVSASSCFYPRCRSSAAP
jgi:hypothetical protein